MSVLAMALLACSSELKSERERYRKLLSLPDGELRSQFRQLPPEDQVGLYLHGVESWRPSEYFLAEYIDLSDRTIVDLMVEKLNTSESQVRTFGLVYALSGLIRLDASQINFESGIQAMQACDRFYRRPSPCHQLAVDIDARYPTR